MQTPGPLQAKRHQPKGVKLHSLLLLLTGQRRHCRVEGESMRPTLSSGDFVIFNPLTDASRGKSLHEGCIVVANHPLLPKKLMVKRVQKIGVKGVELRGDNLNSSTDSRQFGLVRREDIKGVVESIIALRKEK